MRLPLLLSVMLTIASSIAPSDGRARSQAAGCEAGPSLLLVQAVVNDFPDRLIGDGLRVIDSCGQELGEIDVPTPALVWPTARPAVAIVQTSTGTDEEDTGETYLVDAAELTAMRLDIPAMTLDAAESGLSRLTYRQSPSYALVGSVGDEPRIFLVDLETADVTDVLAGLPAGLVQTGEILQAWVEPADDTLVVQLDGERVVAPVDDLAAAERGPAASPVTPAPLDADGCSQVLGDDGASLLACKGSDGDTEWRVRESGDATAEPVSELPGFDPVSFGATWSTGWGAEPFVRTPFSYDNLYSGGRPLEWLIFAEDDTDDRALYVPLIEDTSEISIVDVPAGTVTSVAGLPSGRGDVEIVGTVGGGPLVLMLVMPWSDENNGLFEDDDVYFAERVIVTGELFLVDLETAIATSLGDARSGAISPDAEWLATTQISGDSFAESLAVGPVGGELVEVRPGFGTWLTP